MFRYFLFICAVVLLAYPSWAQLYDDRHQEMVAPMDRAANQVNDLYADVPIAGADEDVKPQDVRYQNMTVPLNDANERHFDQGTNVKTIIDHADKSAGD